MVLVQALSCCDFLACRLQFVVALVQFWLLSTGVLAFGVGVLVGLGSWTMRSSSVCVDSLLNKGPSWCVLDSLKLLSYSLHFRAGHVVVQSLRCTMLCLGLTSCTYITGTSVWITTVENLVHTYIHTYVYVIQETVSSWVYNNIWPFDHCCRGILEVFSKLQQPQAMHK